MVRPNTARPQSSNSVPRVSPPEPIARKAGATVAVRPVDYNMIFAQSGGLPLPKRSPQRQAYRMMELKRWRDHLGIPIVLEPRNFPAKSPLAAQTIIAARAAGQDALRSEEHTSELQSLMRLSYAVFCL